MDDSEKTGLALLPVALASVAGLAWAGSAHGARIGGVPLFAICAALAITTQWVAFVPAYLGRTERYYDLVGSGTYLALTTAGALLGPTIDARSGLLAALVSIWAVRLGGFLFRRIHAAGADRRFDRIKTSFARFLVAWTLQGVWISFTMGAALAVITSERVVPLGAFAWTGLALWTAGFGIEVAADEQKRRFRSRPENRERFIESGLWAWSRHPNYFGEILLWTGVAVIAFPALTGWQLVTLISPIFVTVLLTTGSGIPILEERADARWGGEPSYEAYKRATPVLIPRPPEVDGR